MPFEAIDPETGQFMYPRPDLGHVTCCDKNKALCGEEEIHDPATPRTEDCLTCLTIEDQLNRDKRGCGSPRCPYRNWLSRLLLWLFQGR